MQELLSVLRNRPLGQELPGMQLWPSSRKPGMQVPHRLGYYRQVWQGRKHEKQIFCA